MDRARLKPLEIVTFDSIQELEGAVKVCVRYGPGKSGKTRCLQWHAGPGYAEGPFDRGDGTANPRYFIEAARVRADGTKITRKYRYRSGKKPLPYPPRTVRGGRFNPKSVTTQSRWDDLPEPVKAKIVTIINEGTMKPLGPEELRLLTEGKS